MATPFPRCTYDTISELTSVIDHLRHYNEITVPVNIDRFLEMRIVMGQWVRTYFTQHECIVQGGYVRDTIEHIPFSDIDCKFQSGTTWDEKHAFISELFQTVLENRGDECTFESVYGDVGHLSTISEIPHDDGGHSNGIVERFAICCDLAPAMPIFIDLGHCDNIYDCDVNALFYDDATSEAHYRDKLGSLGRTIGDHIKNHVFSILNTTIDHTDGEFIYEVETPRHHRSRFGDLFGSCSDLLYKRSKKLIRRGWFCTNYGCDDPTCSFAISHAEYEHAHGWDDAENEHLDEHDDVDVDGDDE
jgi:hypothetical protein